jgi:hypothetical protein
MGKRHCQGLELEEVYTVTDIEDKKIYIHDSNDEQYTIWNCCFVYIKKVKSTLMDLKI